MFIVTGATGNTGSIVARTLLEAGKPVRVFVRDANKAVDLAQRGAEVVVGELDDKAAVARAFAGGSSLYLMSPPDPTSRDFVVERRALLQSLARAAAEAKIGHVVFLSSVGAQHAMGTGPIRTLHAGEQALEATGLPVTFVRAAYFLENWAAVLPAARQDGVLPSFLPAGLSVPTVSVRDIGQVAARALLDGPRGRRIIELGGPRDVTPHEVAAAAGKVLGRPVSVAEGPLSAVVPTFTSFGFSENVAGLFQEMYAGLINGRVVWEGGRDSESVRGSTSVEEGLRALAG